MYRLIMALAMAVATCFAVGCGGSSDEATSAPLTKAEFIKQADAICTKINKEAEVAAASWKKGFPGGIAEAEEHPDDGLRKVLVPSMEREAEQLETLEPPAKDEAMVTRFIENLSRASETLDREGFKVLSQSGILGFKEEVAGYGLKKCGSIL